LAALLPNKDRLIVCLDANVIISAFSFGGIPSNLIDHLYDRDFFHVTGPNILQEVRRNLVVKMNEDEETADRFLTRLERISTLIVPGGKLKAGPYEADNKVLEVALIGECDVLVTGDKKHLLPLNPFQGVIIESPANFLKRLKTPKGP
jgi:putative PIN family toxin of toxin-antitoxin system